MVIQFPIRITLEQRLMRFFAEWEMVEYKPVRFWHW